MEIKLKRGTFGDWFSANPVLAEGELALELGSRKIKVGDGTTAWRSLPYSYKPTYAISEITNLQTTLTSLQTQIDNKAASIHIHAQADVTGLVAALAAKTDQQQFLQFSPDHTIVLRTGAKSIVNDISVAGSTVTIDHTAASSVITAGSLSPTTGQPISVTSTSTSVNTLVTFTAGTAAQGSAIRVNNNGTFTAEANTGTPVYGRPRYLQTNYVFSNTISSTAADNSIFNFTVDGSSVQDPNGTPASGGPLWGSFKPKVYSGFEPVNGVSGGGYFYNPQNDDSFNAISSEIRGMYLVGRTPLSIFSGTLRNHTTNTSLVEARTPHLQVLPSGHINVEDTNFSDPNYGFNTTPGTYTVNWVLMSNPYLLYSPHLTTAHSVFGANKQLCGGATLIRCTDVAGIQPPTTLADAEGYTWDDFVSQISDAAIQGMFRQMFIPLAKVLLNHAGTNVGSFDVRPDNHKTGKGGYIGRDVTYRYGTTVNNPQLHKVAQKVSTITGFTNTSALNIDTANVHIITFTGGAITFTINTGLFDTNVRPGRAFTSRLVFTNASGAVTGWGANIKWPGGVNPTLSAGYNIFDLTTYDGGTTWFGEVVGTYV